MGHQRRIAGKGWFRTGQCRFVSADAAGIRRPYPFTGLRHLLMLGIQIWPIAAIWVVSVPPLLSAHGIVASAAQATPDKHVTATSAVVKKRFITHLIDIVN